MCKNFSWCQIHRGSKDWILRVSGSPHQLVVITASYYSTVLFHFTMFENVLQKWIFTQVVLHKGTVVIWLGTVVYWKTPQQIFSIVCSNGRSIKTGGVLWYLIYLIWEWKREYNFYIKYCVWKKKNVWWRTYSTYSNFGFNVQKSIFIYVLMP